MGLVVFCLEKFWGSRSRDECCGGGCSRAKTEFGCGGCSGLVCHKPVALLVRACGFAPAGFQF